MTTARSRTRRVIFDPRLAIGLALVVGSVAGVYAIVASADDSVSVYTAAETLSPGDRVDVSELDTRTVRLDGGTELYLVPGDVPEQGLVITRSVDAGELVPASAVGSVDGLRLTSVVLTVDGQLAASVAPGTTVDVWSSRTNDRGEFATPAVIVSGATVVRLVSSETIVAGAEVTAIEVLVPKNKVARVLEAVANDDAISVVPATLPGTN